MNLRRSLFGVALVLAACTDAAPLLGPGTLTATLRSPNGPEGAAVLLLVGEGVAAVSSAGGAEAHSFSTGQATRVVLIHPDGGSLSFDVEMADRSRPPVAVIREVAGPDDRLRSDLTGYRLEFSP